MLSAVELVNRGSEHWARGEYEGARLSYLAALEIDPINIYALANLGTTLGNDQNKLKSAEVIFQKLVRLDPNNGNHWNSLGNVLFRQSKFDEAFVAIEKAGEFISFNPAYWHNRGLLLYGMHSYEPALRCFEQTEALGGGSESLRNDIAHVLLGMGNLSSALEMYEARWALLTHLPTWDFHIPEWRGEDLENKTIVLHAEQGYGDTIMTVRFAEQVRKLGAKVVLAVPPDLIRLFEAQDWDCTDLLKFSEKDARGFDFHSPLYSAMRWLEIERDKIDSRPYINAPEISVPSVFRGNVLNIGICWTSGRRGGKHDWRMRHAPLENWLPLAKDPGIQLWSLQKGPDSEEIQTLGAENLIKDATFFLDDWAATAAFINKLDLVISVDTAIVHLAGAMGKPCWMLSQYTHCWRWWEIGEGSGRPWYDSVKIIIQETPGDWKSQIEEAVLSLKLRPCFEFWPKTPIELAA